MQIIICAQNDLDERHASPVNKKRKILMDDMMTHV